MHLFAKEVLGSLIFPTWSDTVCCLAVNKSVLKSKPNNLINVVSKHVYNNLITLIVKINIFCLSQFKKQ